MSNIMINTLGALWNFYSPLCHFCILSKEPMEYANRWREGRCVGEVLCPYHFDI